MQQLIDIAREDGWELSLSSWKDGTWCAHLSTATNVGHFYVSDSGSTPFGALAGVVHKKLTGQFHD
jgi:hypothetical protein